jgi:hypothetical protein
VAFEKFPGALHRWNAGLRFSSFEYAIRGLFKLKR